jgi:hypothetical protein
MVNLGMSLLLCEIAHSYRASRSVLKASCMSPTCGSAQCMWYSTGNIQSCSKRKRATKRESVEFGTSQRSSFILKEIMRRGISTVEFHMVQRPSKYSTGPSVICCSTQHKLVQYSSVRVGKIKHSRGWYNTAHYILVQCTEQAHRNVH